MHDAAEHSGRKRVVYYDGSCPMCTALMGSIDTSSKREQFDLQDITTATLPEGFTRSAVEKEIHVMAEGKTYKNAAAILKIMEAFPRWRWLARIGNLPVIRHLLPLGYNFVAANRHFLFGPASRVYWLKVVIGVGFIASLLLSSKLWVGPRWYPFSPMFELLPPVSHPLDWVLFLALLSGLGAMVVISRPRLFIWISVAAVALLVLFDQQRLQPWVYQYTFMLAALGLFSWKWDDVMSRNTTLNVCRFIVASIYFWSGLQKVNMAFIGTVFPWMSAPIVELFPMTMYPALYSIGAFVPFIEMGIGIGLLTKRFRTLAIGGAVAMCVFVLWTLGPFGHQWNSVVWPWNITMLTLVLVLFARSGAVPLRQILWVRNFAFHKLVLVVFGALPLFYFFNAWDSYPSWSLYSGTTNEAVLYVSDRVYAQLPELLRTVTHRDDNGVYVLPILDWAFAEMNVPPYPETRVFKNVARTVCAFAAEPHEVMLVMYGRSPWFFKEGRQSLTCDQLRRPVAGGDI